MAKEKSSVLEKVLDLLFQLVENGSENKSVVFMFLFSVYLLMTPKTWPTGDANE